MLAKGEVVFGKASHAIFSGGTSNATGYELWSVGGRGWIRSPQALGGRLLAIPASSIGAESGYRFSEFKVRMPRSRNVGTEHVGDADLVHWTASLPKNETSNIDMFEATGRIDVWMNPADGYVRIFKLTAEATPESMPTRDTSFPVNTATQTSGEGTSSLSMSIELTMQVYDVGARINIDPPRDAGTAITFIEAQRLADSSPDAATRFRTQASVKSLAAIANSYGRSGIQALNGALPVQ